MATKSEAWTRKRFFALPSVSDGSKWDISKNEVRVLEQVIKNWLSDAQPISALQFRIKGRPALGALERLGHRQAIQLQTAGDQYVPTLFGLVTAIVVGVAGIRNLVVACQKVFLTAKRLFKANPTETNRTYESFQAICDVPEPLCSRATELLSAGGVGLNLHNTLGQRYLQISEHVTRYSNLWEYFALLATSNAASKSDSWLAQLEGLDARYHFGEALAQVHNGADLVKKAVEQTNSDPAAAITAARTLVEATLRWVLHDSDSDCPPASTPAQMLRKCLNHIGLDSGKTRRDTGMGQMLSGMETALHGLAKMRDELGDAHGRKPGTPSPTRRQARMAVGLALTLSSFIAEAWDAQKRL